jgi:hypothetical protein
VRLVKGTLLISDFSAKIRLARLLVSLPTTFLAKLSFWLLPVHWPEARPGFVSNLILHFGSLVSSPRAADSAVGPSVFVVLLDGAAPATKSGPFH